MTLELKKFDMKTISFRPDENKGPVIVLILMSLLLNIK